MPSSRKKPWPGDWGVTIRDILGRKFPDLAPIAIALRGTEPVPEEVRVFFAQLIERKRIKYPGKGRRAPDLFTQETDADFLLKTYEFELELAQGGWRPKGISARDHHLAGTPAEVAIVRTAKAVAEKGIVGQKGKPLKADAMRKRLKEARKILGR